jgi:hypothetical protein
MVKIRKQTGHSNWSSIALWGPTGAGKDWLVRAFNRELRSLNDWKNRFSYDLKLVRPGSDREFEVPAFADPPGDILATEESEDTKYAFYRKDTTFPVEDKRHCQRHEFILHNDAGGALVKCLENEMNHNATLETLLQSRNIIIVLGVGNLGLNTHHEPYENQEKNGEKDEKGLLFKKIMQLIDRLSVEPRRNIAICLTKIDLIVDENEFTQQDRWNVLSEQYGNDARNYLESMKKKFSNMEVFITTSAGYVNSNGVRDKNINQDATGLKDPAQWKPLNTVAPFFWIFEKIEDERYKSISLFRKIIFSEESKPVPYLRYIKTDRFGGVRNV